MRIPAAVLGALLFVAAPAASAQPPIIESARQEIETAMQETGSSSGLETRTAAKQEAFLKIIRFSKLEGENLIAALASLAARELDAPLAARLAEMQRQLEAARDHFARIEEIIADGADPIPIASIETIAEAFREWRIKSYDPLIREAMEVRLMIQARDALDIAETRFSKIAAAVGGLGGGKLKDALEPLLGRAEQHLQNARFIVREVERLSRDPSASFAPAIQALPRGRSGPVVQELLAQAIGRLKSAYGAFMDMNEAVQTAGERNRGLQK